MDLESYESKRALSKTPEPGKGGAKPDKVLRFVVHKHSASHLHYDFRLELDGVLKSWAVPKGPSLDPSIKRLAMMVEDHPYEYRNFEGVIPQGNYGAGEVIVWDQGTYHAVSSTEKEASERLLREGLRKGDLKFVLDGHRLRGEFALVRMKTEKENSWLLVKKKDPYATGEEVTRFDSSVVSGLTIEDLRGAGKGPQRERPAPGKAPDRKEEAPEEGEGIAASGKETAPSQMAAGGEASGRPEEQRRPRRPGATGEKRAARSLSSGGKDPEEAAKEAPQAPMPHGIRPMLATSVPDPFDDPDWIFEIKLDGYRCLAEVDKGKALIYSRNNISFNQKFPGVAQALEGMGRDAVFDGEVVVLDEKGRSYFQLLQNYQRTGEGNIFYYVFDLLYLDGHDLQGLPLLTRKQMLQEMLPDLPNVRYSDHIVQYGRDFFELAKTNNLEGIVAKRADSRYLAGRRSRDWQKIKTRLQQETVICGYTKPRKSRKHLGALVLGVYQDNELVHIGMAGGGFDEKSLQDTFERLQPLVQYASPFRERVSTDMQVQWVKPVLVCEVAFSEWTDEKVMRHPVFLGLREDKDPRQVVREEFSAAAQPLESTSDTSEKAPQLQTAEEAEAAAKPEKAKNKVLIIGGNRLELTNLDKVFWPEEGYTKGDVINYYRKVAATMLPYLKDRPESLYRTPHGINRPGFFQKEAGELPPQWIRTKEIFSKHVNKNIKFFVCQDEATLVYMANLGCIEINPWLSRLQSLDQPDYLVIDLDPEDISFDRVIETALAVHEVLERAGAASFPKTSGATGMHIYLPLAARYDYKTAENFAKLISTIAHHLVPGFTSLLRSPQKRQKKVYLDFLQNKAGQTLAAPYSIRPRPGATVSAPLRWEEVKAGLDPGQFTIESMPLRLQEVGDLFQGVLGPGISIEECLARLESG